MRYLTQRDIRYIREKMKDKLKPLAKEVLDEIKIENEKYKKECSELLAELESLANNGSKLAKETVEYFNGTWKSSLYRDGMYRTVVNVFRETIDSIEKGLYE